MKFEYKPPGLKDDYENERIMKKKYGDKIAVGMLKFLGALKAATNANDLKRLPVFFMEHKKGNLKEYYSVSLDKKRSKWRLMIQMIDENGKVLVPTDNETEFLKSIKIIRIKEMSEHYDEY